MHRFILALSCILMVLAAPIFSQDFQKGLKTAQSGDFATALKEWKPLFESGDSATQFNLDIMHRTGQGVPQDDKEAAKWFRLAAEQGQADAQNNLGFMYENGQNFLVDYVIENTWYNTSAANGNKDGAKNRENLAKEMMSEDISKAQATATVLMHSDYVKCGY